MGHASDDIVPCRQAPARRLLLLGSATSGSTLLGAFLALSRDVTALGEVCEHRRTNLVRHRCTCGHTIGECPLWGDVLWPARRQQWTDVDILEALSRVVVRVTGARWIADSVKHPEGFGAQCALGTDSAAALLLVRHPCGYAFSQLAHGRDLDRSARRWVADQREAFALLEDRPMPHLVVRYEDLTSDAVSELDAVASSLGLAPPPTGSWVFGEGWGPGHHLVCGSAWRFRGPPSTVRPDERWRTVLSPSDQRRILAVAGGTAERFGYRI